MEQFTRDAIRSHEEARAQRSAQNSRPVGVERTFRAPVERVWEAWSDPKLAKQWWGPEGYTCPEAKIDFKEGGKYLFAMQGPDQKLIWSGGTYEEILPNEKIVCTDQFTDEKGNPVSAKQYGMPGEWPESLTVTIQFEANGENDTKMILRHEGIPEEMHDECVQGWNSSFNKLQRLTERT